jgi:N-acetylmuramoyl-L-alanine amidase
MRIAVLLIFLAGIFCAQAQPSLASLGKVRFEGAEYVRVRDWAFVTKLDLRWLVKERDLQATNAASQILFTMNSRSVRINGINLLLSLPVILQNDKVYISTLDLSAAIHPILFPEKIAEGAVIKTVCLDAGHGGKDPGKLDGSNQEKTYALLLAGEIERILKQADFKVIQTRWRDVFIDLPDRPKVANENAADLFISLHYNAAANRNAQGSEVYCLTPVGASSSNGGAGNSTAPTYSGSVQNDKNILLAFQMQKSLVKNLYVEDRGVKRAQFAVLASAKMPAILIEAGFMTNPAEAKRIYDPVYRKKMAASIVDGILAYKRAVER